MPSDQYTPSGRNELETTLLRMIELCRRDGVGHLDLEMSGVRINGEDAGDWQLKLNEVRPDGGLTSADVSMPDPRAETRWGRIEDAPLDGTYVRLRGGTIVDGEIRSANTQEVIAKWAIHDIGPFTSLADKEATAQYGWIVAFTNRPPVRPVVVENPTHFKRLEAQ